MNCITCYLNVSFLQKHDIEWIPEDPIVLVSQYSEHTEIYFISQIPYHSSEISSHRIICNLLYEIGFEINLIFNIAESACQSSLFDFCGYSWTHSPQTLTLQPSVSKRIIFLPKMCTKANSDSLILVNGLDNPLVILTVKMSP